MVQSNPKNFTVQLISVSMDFDFKFKALPEAYTYTQNIIVSVTENLSRRL